MSNAQDRASTLKHTSAEFPLHPLCTFFPRMGSCELQELAGDIKLYGLRNPIVLHDGMILDGGNRYQACLYAGVEPTFIEYDGDNIVAFVLSMNMYRRHMTLNQFAVITSLAQDWGKAHLHGGNRKPEQGAQSAPCSSVADRMALSGACERTQKSADKVAKSDPELAKQVAKGEVSLPAAVKKVDTAKPAKPQKDNPASEPKAAAQETLAVEVALREFINEQGKSIADLLDENTSMQLVFDADEKLAAAMAENKKYRELNRVLDQRIRGLQGEIIALKKATESWKRRCEKAEKSCKPT